MFEPNSIRSLLKKRNLTKLSSQNQTNKQQKQKMSKTFTDFSSISKNNTDPDIQSVIQAKMMIKQIDHEVSNIRNWRQHQKILLQQKLKNNSQIYNLSKDQYQKFIDQKVQEEINENKRLIQKMKINENKLKRNRQNNSLLIDNANSQTLQSSQAGQVNQDWEGGLYDPVLMANIAQADDKINKKKYMKSQLTQQFKDTHKAFINSINQLSCSDIFTKKNKVQGSQDQNNKNSLDKELLRKQLDDIDKELRQMQDLLKD